MKATVIGKDGDLHVKVVDEHGQPHWLLPQQTSGQKLKPGQKVKLENRQPIGWFIKQEK